MSINEQLELFGISKGLYYYRPKGITEETHKLMEFIDKEHSEFLGKGVVGMRDAINEKFESEKTDFRIGERRVRRLMHMMNIHASYSGPKLSVIGSTSYVHPYRLKGLTINFELGQTPDITIVV